MSRNATSVPRNRNVNRILTSIDTKSAANGRAFFLLVGLPGVGKSTFAQALASLTGAVVLESDRFRVLLFDTPVHSQRESAILFRALRAAARSLLDDGHGVIIDATNLSESDRRPFYDLADDLNVPLIVVVLEAPSSIVEQRLTRRLGEANGYSYADLDVYHRMKARREPVSREHRRIDTSNSAAVEAALTAIAADYGEVVKRGNRA